MIRKSYPSCSCPYSAALISLSVPSTPTRSTRTSTPRPFGMSLTSGVGISARCALSGFPGVTAIAFILSPSFLSTKPHKETLKKQSSCFFVGFGWRLFLDQLGPVFIALLDPTGDVLLPHLLHIFAVIQVELSIHDLPRLGINARRI